MKNKSCTFFGHRYTSEEIRPILQNTLTKLIEKEGIDTFFVGNHGHFDHMVHEELKKLTKIYPQIHYSVVLAYIPGKRNEFLDEDYSDTVYPAGLEKVPPKFAIIKRNQMMIEWSDIVVTCICHLGGAADFKEFAQKKGKKIIELNDLIPKYASLLPH